MLFNVTLLWFLNAIKLSG